MLRRSYHLNSSRRQRGCAPHTAKDEEGASVQEDNSRHQPLIPFTTFSGEKLGKSTMNLERVPNEEKLNLCRKYYLGGFALLPFLWLVNVIWFFKEAFLKPSFTEQMQMKTYVKRSALGVLLWAVVLCTWITVFQHFRAEWGEVGDYLSFTIPLGTPTPVDGIQWEKVLPPLIPRLNGTYGQYNWSPKLLISETENASSAEVNCDDSGFTIQVDVKHFKPEDLMVKVIGDFVEVQGRHEEKKKNGSGLTTRQFNRRYRVPKEVDVMALESAVSPSGVLIISAPILPPDNGHVLS